MTTKETNNKRGIFLRLSRYVLEQWPLFLLALALTLGSNQLSLLGPRYSGAAIDAIELAGGVDFPAVWEKAVGCGSGFLRALTLSVTTQRPGASDVLPAHCQASV